MELDGASAIVTGGASGLGEATARALAARGATVVIVPSQRSWVSQTVPCTVATLSLPCVV